MKKLVNIFATTLLLVSAFLTVQPAFAESTIDRVKAKGELVLGTGNYRPFEYFDEHNKMVGYDIELAQLIAQKLGVKLKVQDMQFTGLIPSLQSGHTDIIIAAMYINDARKQVVDFANPYMETGMILAVKKENTHILQPQDLAGLTVGVKSGAASENVARDLQKSGIDFTIKTYKETVDEILDLNSGRIDAAINDLLNQLELNKVYQNVKVVGQPFTQAELGIAVQKGDQAFVNLINEVLAEMEKNGQKEALYKKWIIGE